jgi:hypothetical protein
MQYAPPHVCRALSEFHPQLRLGWDGELGKFGLIQLYARRAAAQTFRHRWNIDSFNGPVFSRSGRVTPDWDPWTRTPIYLIDVDPADVHSGAIVQMAKRWARPIVARMYKDAKQRARQTETDMEAMGREMGHDLYRGSQSSSERGPVVAKKFVTPDPSLQRYRDGGLDFSEPRFVTPPGGVEKHLEADKGDA